MLGPAARFSVLSRRPSCPRTACAAGCAGAPNRFFIIRDGQAVEPSPLPGKVSGFPVRAGDRPPHGVARRRRLRRPARARPGAASSPTSPKAMSRPAAAETSYGVVLRRGRARRRGHRGATRGAPGRAAPRACGGGPRSRRRTAARPIRLDAETAARLGVGRRRRRAGESPRSAPARLGHEPHRRTAPPPTRRPR